MENFSIAIDGPSSAGKSTIAKKVASQLGLVYLDTGAMYRSLTYAAIQRNISLEDEAALLELLNGGTISFQSAEGMQRIFWDSEEVTDAIRQTDVTQQVSLVSSHAAVRTEMVRRQRAFTEAGGIVMDGRDIGTVVMPHAPLKIFLVAEVTERARRRYQESIDKGMDVSLEEITEDLIRRDHYDSNRKASPLKKAEDAIEIDSTYLSIDEVVEKVLHLAKGKMSTMNNSF